MVAEHQTTPFERHPTLRFIIKAISVLILSYKKRKDIAARESLILCHLSFVLVFPFYLSLWLLEDVFTNSNSC